MILDKIRNNHLYDSTHPLFQKAFDFLSTTDLENIALGKHLIEGDALFAIVMEYDTQEAVHCKVETHKKIHRLTIHDSWGRIYWSCYTRGSNTTKSL